MKKIILFILTIFLFSACEDSDLWTEATLIKSQHGLPCYCCNGVYLTFNNDTFLTSLPTDFKINAFPLDVKIKYNNEESDCNFIDVYEIKK